MRVMITLALALSIQSHARLPSTDAKPAAPATTGTQLSGISSDIAYRGCMMGCLGPTEEKACAEKCAGLFPDAKAYAPVSDAGCRGLHTRERTKCLQQKYLNGEPASASLAAPVRSAESSPASSR